MIRSEMLKFSAFMPTNMSIFDFSILSILIISLLIWLFRLRPVFLEWVLGSTLFFVALGGKSVLSCVVVLKWLVVVLQLPEVEL